MKLIAKSDDLSMICQVLQYQSKQLIKLVLNPADGDVIEVLRDGDCIIIKRQDSTTGCCKYAGTCVHKKSASQLADQEAANEIKSI